MSTPDAPTPPPESQSDDAVVYDDMPDAGGGFLRGLAIAFVAIVFSALAITVTLRLANSADASEAGGGTHGSGEDPTMIAAGQQVAAKTGCFTCHTADGTKNRGPTWKGLWGSTVTYDDGTTAVIDDAAVREALRNPTAKIIQGYEGIMPAQKNMPEQDIKNLLAYMHSIGAGK